MRWHHVIMLGLIGVALSAPSCAGQDGDPEWDVFIAEAGSGRGWLGVVVEDMTERMARRMGVETTSGALVNEVVEKSPAERAGLKVDDIIVAVDERTIRDGDDLVRAVRKIDPETSAKITVVRARQRLTIPVEVGSRSRGPAQMGWVWPGMEHEARILGMQLRNLTGQLAAYFKVPGGRGVLVEEVESGSAAGNAGLQAGDVILRCASEPVRDIDDLKWVLEDVAADQTLPLVVLRAGSQRTLDLKVPEQFSGPARFYFRDHLFHFSPPVPDAKLLKEQIEREIPREIRHGLRQEQLHLRGLEHSMETLQRELEVLGRRLEKEAKQAKESLQRALRSTVL
jgi:membrane-associated protease RseP (regulator of RpoE activity)